MTSDAVLDRARRYLPALHRVLNHLSVHGLHAEDGHEAVFWGFLLVALREGETDEARALRQWLCENTGSANPTAGPSRPAALLKQVAPHLEVLEAVWRLVSLEADREGAPVDPWEVLTAGLRIIQTEKALVLLGCL